MARKFLGVDFLSGIPDWMKRKAAPGVAAKPELGIKTSQQVGAGVFGFPGSVFFPGLPQLPSTFFTYRQIRGNPTVALARLASNGPIKTCKLSFELGDNGDDTMLAYIKANLTPQLWRAILKDAVRARDYGFHAWEKNWEIRNGDYFLAGVKPLLPEATNAIYDTSTGQLIGAQNFNTPLPLDKLLWIIHDDEAARHVRRAAAARGRRTQE